jgi:zinc transporter 1
MSHQKLAQRPRTSRLTYGWGRAEILGGLINGVFLISVVFYIYMEAIQRLIEPQIIENPLLVLIVGIIGLLVNLIGLVMFRGHAHGHSHSNEEVEHEADADLETRSSNKKTSHHNHNMFGVFLHILGDFLGSIGVIISSVLLLIVDIEKQKWAKYVDPVVSAILATIILASTIPLVKNCSKILLQSVPDNIDLAQVRSQIQDLEGVYGVHELHVWHHANSRTIGTLHIKCARTEDFMTLAPRIQRILHSHGIHSTTIQPEYVALPQNDKENGCKLKCAVDGSREVQDWQELEISSLALLDTITNVTHDV